MVNKLGRFAAACAAAVLGVSSFGATCSYTDGAWDTTPSGESDDIVIVSGDLTWGAAFPHKVASWTQAEDYTNNTVTFETTYGDAFPQFEVTGNVVLNGGKWTHKANNDAETYRLDIKVGGNMTIGAKASVHANGKGYAGRKGPGSGNASDWFGAAHGGHGWNGLNNKFENFGQCCYGSVTKPTELGSGSACGNGPSAGGGAVRLVVNGMLTNAGTISAYGASAAWYAVGAGGSIWITAGTLAGTGPVDAGASSGRYGPYCTSGGGRVAVWLTDATADFEGYEGLISAYGAFKNNSTTEAAPCGTVYLKTGAEADNEGTLIIDNGGANSVCTTDIGPKVADAEVGSVVVKSGAWLKIIDGCALTVRGNFTNDGKVTTEAGSQLVFAGSGASTLDGDLSVHQFVCRTSGKTLAFADGTLLSVSEKFIVEGAAEQPVALTAAAGASSWKLNVASSAEQTVTRVSAEKCDASAGAQVIAIDSTVDGDTRNWKTFTITPGQEVVWTGASGGTSWLSPGNWDIGRAPVETDIAVVNAAAVQPTLTKALTIAGLTIGTGATLSLGGYDLTVVGDLAVNGTILPADTEWVAVGGNATLNADGLVAKRSTFVLNGTAAQTFDPKETSFYNLVWGNASAGGLTVSSSFSTLNLTAETEAAMKIAFADGITATCTAGLVFSGDATAKNLELGPVEAGKTWNLAVSGTAAVRLRSPARRRL